MPKLPRVTGKIFASNAAEGDIGQYGSALTGTKVATSDIAEIQALPAYEEGWRGAVISDRNYPTLQEMNGLQKTFSQQIAYLLERGIPEWDTGTTYYTNSCAMGSDGNIYKSLTDDNIGNNPTTDSGTNWVNIVDGLYNKITNCILAAPNGVATYSGSTITVKQGLKVLMPNGRNADGTLKNIEYTLQSDVSVSLPSDRNGIEFITLTNNGELAYWDTNDVGYIYKEPQSNLNWKYYDEDDNIYKYTINGASYVDSLEVPVLLANVTNGVIISLTPYQPVELLKRSDKAEISHWATPDSYRIQANIFNSTVTTSRQIFTPPCDGVVVIGCDSTVKVFLTASENRTAGTITYAAMAVGKTGGGCQRGWVIVSKGDIVEVQTSTGTTTLVFSRFTPLIGAN